MLSKNYLPSNIILIGSDFIHPMACDMLHHGAKKFKIQKLLAKSYRVIVEIQNLAAELSCRSDLGFKSYYKNQFEITKINC